MQKGWRKIILVAVGVTIAAVAVYAILPGRGAAEPARYKSATAKNRNISSMIIADGRVTFEDEIAVSAEVIARVESIQARAGDEVKTGQVLVVLDDKQIAAQVSQRQFSYDASRSDAQQARAALALAEEKLKRLRPLASRAFVSAMDLQIQEKEFEQAREALNSAVSNQKLAGAALEESRQLLGKTVIRSPIDGTVLSVDTSVGETAVPSTQSFAGTALMRLAKMGQLLVKANIGEADVGRVRVGDEARVYLPALNNAGVAAKLKHIALAANSGAAGDGRGPVTFQVTFVLHGSPDSTIRTGMSGRVELVRRGAAIGMVTVPVEAVRPAPGASDDKFVVWRVKNGGKIEQVSVTLGLADDVYQEVAGLAEGDEVIIGPTAYLADLESRNGVASGVDRDSGN